MRYLPFFKLAFLVLGFQFCLSQTKYEPEINRIDTLETTVITLDLSEPSTSSVINSSSSKKLVVPSRNPLAIKLINGNPFRFRYVLNFNKVNLFTNVTFDPKISGADSIENNLTEESDKDGDGIQDSVDNCPYLAGSQYNDGCPMTDTIARKLIHEKVLETKEEISTLNNIIEDYITEISIRSTLNEEELNTRVNTFKKDFLMILTKNAKIEGLIQEGALQNEFDEITSVLDESIEKIRLSIEKLISVETTTYLLPIDVNGENIDYIEIQLDIYEGESSDPETYKYKIWIKGGLKIDVSGGVHLTSLFDRDYFTTDLGNSQRAISESDNGEYDFGFGTMVNIAVRGGSWVRPTLNFGALFTTNQKFQLLSGIGFILGKNERFVLHGGVSMGKISVLRNGYLADGETSYDLGTDGIIPLDEKFQFGHFFGITYNFSKAKSNQSEKN